MTERYVLMLENDPDDRYFTTSTINELNLAVNIRYESSGIDLPEPGIFPPSIVLLACRAFPAEGIAILKKFKSHPTWSHIPIIILTEQLIDEHIRAYYAAGANSVISKPSTQMLTMNKIRTFFDYWFNVAELGQLIPGNSEQSIRHSCAS